MMMSHFDKLRGTALRLMLLIGLVIAALVPVWSWAHAQNGSRPLWVVRSIETSEFGVNQPEGLAFSSRANTFLILDGSGNIGLVTMGGDSAGSRVIPEVQDDPMNAAFDDRTGSLFVFSRGRSELKALGIADAQGIAFDPSDGRLFILDAGNSQIVAVVPHPTLGFDANEAIHANKVQRISLKKFGADTFRGIAYNPSNGHLYVADPAQKRLYELTQSGDLVSTSDLAALGISDPSAMVFAPSADTTDDPNIHDLFLLDLGRTAKSDSRILELSFVAPAALPSATTVLPTTLVQVIDTSNAAWNPSSPDPSGIDYWPLTNRLLIADSEVEEMPNYYQGKNVFQSTTSGTLTNTCDTTAFTNEPTGVAINPNNNHIFFSTDDNDRIFEIILGSDGIYCTADDTVTPTNVAVLYGIGDAEDVAYGNNSLFIAGGLDAEVYRIPLGANGVLGGGDDGSMTHFDTAALGFQDLEGIGYNAASGTLFIVSTKSTDRYLGETTTSGTLLRAYDLSLMGSAGNIRSGVTYAPGSQNPTVKNIYIASRGLDNNSNRNENDGKVWEISLGSSQITPTPDPGLPGKASLISPSGSISSGTPTYTWNKVNAATWYYLYVSDASGTPVIQQWYQSSVCSSSTCSATPSVTLSDGNYRWWIQTWNSGGYGPWSSGMSFSVQTILPPSAATLVAPSGITTDNIPTYRWNRVSAATWYYLYVSDASGTPVIQQWYQSSVACSSSTCSATPSVTLSDGNYRWWIQTWNLGGYGPWSTGMSFSLQTTAPPGVATLISPSGAISDSSPMYRWNQVNASTWYYLYVSDASGTPVIQQWYQSSVCGGSTCSATPGVTLSGGNYRWWIQTWNSGGYGPWSTGMNFSVP